MTYDFEWHAMHGDRTEASAKIVLQELKTVFDYQSILDIGCGDGRWLKQALSGGVTTIAGVDGPWTDVKSMMIPVDCLYIRDFSKTYDLGRRFDVAICLEVAEHVAPEHAEQFVASLAARSDCVLFGAAIPYQGGFRHINERWQSYWAKLFAAEGYQVFDLFRERLWANDRVHFWYKQNMLLYIKETRGDLIEAARNYLERERLSQLPIDIVHPEKYEAVASYSQIAFRPLLRRLPGQALRKVISIAARKT